MLIEIVRLPFSTLHLLPPSIKVSLRSPNIGTPTRSLSSLATSTGSCLVSFNSYPLNSSRICQRLDGINQQLKFALHVLKFQSMAHLQSRGIQCFAVRNRQIIILFSARFNNVIYIYSSGAQFILACCCIPFILTWQCNCSVRRRPHSQPTCPAQRTTPYER